MNKKWGLSRGLTVLSGLEWAVLLRVQQIHD